MRKHNISFRFASQLTSEVLPNPSAQYISLAGLERLSKSLRDQATITPAAAAPSIATKKHPLQIDWADNKMPNSVDASPFEYQALEEILEIRLLELEPSDSDENPIVCQMTDHDLLSKPVYEVLTYDNKNPSSTVPVSVNGKRLDVPIDLWLALRRLRSKTERRCFWTDICIDQSHPRAREQRIEMTRGICLGAEQLTVWIGEESEESHLVFQHIKNWHKYREEYEERVKKGIRNDILTSIGILHSTQGLSKKRSCNCYSAHGSPQSRQFRYQV